VALHFQREGAVEPRAQHDPARLPGGPSRREVYGVHRVRKGAIGLAAALPTPQVPSRPALGDAALDDVPPKPLAPHNAAQVRFIEPIPAPVVCDCGPVSEDHDTGFGETRVACDRVREAETERARCGRAFLI